MRGTGWPDSRCVVMTEVWQLSCPRNCLKRGQHWCSRHADVSWKSAMGVCGAGGQVAARILLKAWTNSCCEGQRWGR